MSRRDHDNGAAVAKFLWEASPEGRTERLEAILSDMRINGEDFDVGHYRRRVELARAAIGRGDIAEARTCLAQAEHALTEIDYITDSDRLRGLKTRQAASEGGTQRASNMKAESEALLFEMKRLLATKPEGSISWAAKVARDNGYGSSVNANRQAWYRSQKKL